MLCRYGTPGAPSLTIYAAQDSINDSTSSQTVCKCNDMIVCYAYLFCRLTILKGLVYRTTRECQDFRIMIQRNQLLLVISQCNQSSVNFKNCWNQGVCPLQHFFHLIFLAPVAVHQAQIHLKV